MKDRRVAFARSVLSELVESLDATVRIGRWSGEEVPPPLRASAGLLIERLGKANRLAASRFVGAPKSAAAYAAVISAIQRLDLAFVAYRNAHDKTEAERLLDSELAAVSSETDADMTA
jgi:hypothetical protein